MFKPYIYGAMALVFITTGGGLYLKGRADGKAVILNQLAADQVKILKDGKEVDNEVFNSDDTALCVLLGGC